MRWPGSMREWPADDVVLEYLRIGKTHAGSEPSETLVRLLTAESFQPFGLSTTRRVPDRAAHGRAVEAGLHAAELAMSLGRPDLASAALDGATSAPIDLGMYGEAMGTIEQRLALVPQIEDPWELGDIYAMATWTHMMLGDPRTALRYAEQGIALIDHRSAEGVALHCVSWAAFAEFQLGGWDSVLERAAMCSRMLGDRADAPPYFTAHAFCAAATIHRVRDEQLEFERQRAVVDSLLGATSGHHFQGAAAAWIASIAIREGRFDEADALLASSRTTVTDTPRPFIEMVQAELLAATERWDETPAYLDRTRSYASEAGLLALPHHLDRLEGRWAEAMGQVDAAAALLRGAVTGLSTLGHVWDAARCQLDLAEVLAAGDRRDDARSIAREALPVFRRLGARRELSRCEDIVGTAR
jgi:tetratricopeptide (TPR) repeat protein